ncbi:MAG TPA: GTP 3',8-cyclase MoaA, partial [Pirellulales bacterium]|nr:GTP 3',8-cyclase MoaA [Pirellulales bacterium]
MLDTTSEAFDASLPPHSPLPTPYSPFLVDSFGRLHTDLRISVTDRCNLRCFYCMPAEDVQFKPRDELLTFEEIERVARVAARMGVNKLRLTGGEPLVRREIWKLVELLRRAPGIDDIALTTNGLLLAEQAERLKDAGLDRLNISLDSLDRKTFEQIARRPGLDRVLDGIFAARKAGFDRIRLNTVAVRGLTEREIVPLVEFARRHQFELRFIEFMPLDADGRWKNADVLSGDEIRVTIENAIGPLEPLPVVEPSQPATDYRFVDGSGCIGFINPVTQPFCGN